MTLRVTLVLAAAFLLLVPTIAQATYPGQPGKIAFVSNRDGNREIYTMNADGSNQQNITNHPGSDFNPAWSPDGSMILYTSDRIGEPDGLFLMNANGSGVRRVTSGGITDRAAAWGPDGWRIVYVTTPGSFNQLRRSDLYGTNLGSIYTGSAPAWAPAGEAIVFRRQPDGTAGLAIANSDSSGSLQSLTTSGFDDNPDWSPDGQSILFEHRHAESYQGSGLYTINAGGGVLTRVPGSLQHDIEPAWSPDGSRITFVNDTGTPGLNGDIYAADPDGSNRVQLTTDPAHDDSPVWQPLNPRPATGYARPKGATPLSVSLVPAFQSCETPNRTHGAPLAMPACSPPQPTSDFLTVGNPDTNGAAAQFKGSLRLDVVVGDPAPQADEADVHVQADLRDLRCTAAVFACTAGSGSDYTGELEVNLTLRITDRDSYPVPLDSATTTDVWRFPFTIPCSATGDPSAGSGCSVNTTLDGIMPGVVREGVRSVWEFNKVEVNDGGADGDSDTDDFTLFAVPGVFVP